MTGEPAELVSYAYALELKPLKYDKIGCYRFDVFNDEEADAVVEALARLPIDLPCQIRIQVSLRRVAGFSVADEVAAVRSRIAS